MSGGLSGLSALSGLSSISGIEVHDITLDLSDADNSQYLPVLF